MVPFNSVQICLVLGRAGLRNRCFKADDQIQSRKKLTFRTLSHREAGVLFLRIVSVRARHLFMPSWRHQDMFREWNVTSSCWPWFKNRLCLSSLKSILLILLNFLKQPLDSWFSYDVTAAILVSLNKETTATLMSQTNPQGIAFYSYAKFLFCFGWKTWQLIKWVKTSNRPFTVVCFVAWPLHESELILIKRTQAFLTLMMLLSC